MKIVAGYGRVSTGKQVTDGTSLVDQQNRIITECEHKGWEFSKFYSDPGISGHSMSNRPGLQELIRDAADHRFDLVMFTKLDRVARNLKDLLNFWELMQGENSLDLVCIELPWLDTQSAAGKLMLQMVGAFAEFEREQIRLRMESGRNIVWNQGKLLGTPPFGYRWDKEKGIVVVEEAKTIYDRIVDMYLEGHACADIAIALTRDAAPTPSHFRYRNKASRQGKTWNAPAVNRILKNPAYTGEAQHNRFRYTTNKTGKHVVTKEAKPREEWKAIEYPAFISQEKFDLIQERIAFQKSKPKKHHSGYENHFLCENLLYCGECGGKIKKKLGARKGVPPKPYYVCAWKEASHKALELNSRERCRLVFLDAEAIDDEVFDQIAELLTNTRKFVMAWLKDQDFDEIKTRRKRLRALYDKADKVLKRAFDIVTHEDDDDIRRLLFEKYEKDKRERQKLKADLDRANREYSNYRTKTDRLKEFETAMAEASGFDKMKTRTEMKMKLQQAFSGLPFREQRRMIESVISPENGGKITVGYYRDGKDVSKTDVAVEFDFDLDLSRIEKLITGLNPNGLLNNKDRHPRDAHISTAWSNQTYGSGED